MRKDAKVCSAMQHVNNAIGWNAMKMSKMHHNALWNAYEKLHHFR
jgi:hypothetical protein